MLRACINTLPNVLYLLGQGFRVHVTPMSQLLEWHPLCDRQKGHTRSPKGYSPIWSKYAGSMNISWSSWMNHLESLIYWTCRIFESASTWIPLLSQYHNGSAIHGLSIYWHSTLCPYELEVLSTALNPYTHVSMQQLTKCSMRNS